MSKEKSENQMASTPTSTTSGFLSSEASSEDGRNIPASLAVEELQLAVNKEASIEELERAVIRSKELVLECDQCSVERKWLVRHLIELRLRLQECREAQNDPDHPLNKSSRISNRTIKGHHLVLQSMLKNTNSKYCDHCTGSIWSVVQAWYRCKDCSYCCHHKCLNGIMRECAHVTISEKGAYELNICPEEGLSAQKYLCAECKSALPLDMSWSEPRRCDYTGLYYCTACHWNNEAIIPARVIHNWDLNPRPVSQAALQLIRLTANQPLISLESLNSRLFTLVHELSLVRRLRLELAGMRKYLLVCRLAKEQNLLWKTLKRMHLVETPYLYSIQDLLDTHSGELPSKLHSIVDIFSKHIKKDCAICKGRGHICEICGNDEVLYPFDAAAVVCDNCASVLHKACWTRKNQQCYKCIRMKNRMEKQTTGDDDDKNENVEEEIEGEGSKEGVDSVEDSGFSDIA